MRQVNERSRPDPDGMKAGMHLLDLPSTAISRVPRLWKQSSQSGSGVMGCQTTSFGASPPRQLKQARPPGSGAARAWEDEARRVSRPWDVIIRPRTQALWSVNCPAKEGGGFLHRV
jgi:hypothetical protein